MSRIEIALSRFAAGHNCCQAVLSAYADGLGLDQETALKLSAGFGGGMGRMAETCGAVTGAFMALGLRHAQAAPSREAKEALYVRIREFAERFKARRGALLCRDLLGCDINAPDGLQRAKETGLFSQMCPGFIQDACAILEELL